MSTFYKVTICTDNPDIFPAYTDNDGNFSFDKLIPMPKSLEIASGTVTDEAIAYYVTEMLTKPFEATNLSSLITNTLWPGNWAEEVVIRLENSIQCDPQYTPARLKKLYSLGKQYVFNIENYQFPTWYEWRRANWGSKWDARDSKFDFANPYEISFCITSVPYGIFDKLCSLFPESKIHFTVFCVGEWENDRGQLAAINYAEEEDDYREEDRWEDDDFEDEDFEDDGLQDEDSFRNACFFEGLTPMFLEKVDRTIHTYAIRDGFMVDIIEKQDAWECYLYLESRGVKSRVMTLPREDYVLSDVEDIFISNMKEQAYLLGYFIEFMQ